MNEVTKPKHPGRVAAGKRTAELNRKRKEDLLSNRETVPPQVDSGTESVPGGDSSWKYGGAIAMLIFAGGALYLHTRRATPATLSTPATPSTSVNPSALDNDIFRMH